MKRYWKRRTNKELMDWLRYWEKKQNIKDRVKRLARL
jgi:hypothetical protein